MDVWTDEVKDRLLSDGSDDFYNDIEYRASVGSTNDWLKELALDKVSPARSGTVTVADEQTAGKGRSGHIWVSPAGKNIYFSLLLKPEIPPERASALTLVMGLSVAQAIRDTLGLPAGIKWPNDAVIHGRKICGILTEMETCGMEIHYVVIGTGINVNINSFPEEISRVATSLKIEKNESGDISRALVLAAVLKRFRENYFLYMENENLKSLQSSYNSLLINIGREVRVEDPHGPYTALSRGINETGQLIVETEDGSVRHITSGEVSVRGMYGYV